QGLPRARRVDGRCHVAGRHPEEALHTGCHAERTRTQGLLRRTIMNIQTMQMNPNIARVLYKEYRKKVREHHAERLKKANEKVVEGGKTFRAGRIEKSLIEKEDEALMQ